MRGRTITEVPGYAFEVCDVVKEGVYESWRIVLRDNPKYKGYMVLHCVNDTNSGDWSREFWREAFETVEQAKAKIMESLPEIKNDENGGAR